MGRKRADTSQQDPPRESERQRDAAPKHRHLAGRGGPPPVRRQAAKAMPVAPPRVRTANAHALLGKLGVVERARPTPIRHGAVFGTRLVLLQKEPPQESERQRDAAPKHRHLASRGGPRARRHKKTATVNEAMAAFGDAIGFQAASGRFGRVAADGFGWKIPLHHGAVFGTQHTSKKV